MKGLSWPYDASIQGIWVYRFKRIRMKSSSSWKIVESPTDKKLFLEVAMSLNERSLPDSSASSIFTALLSCCAFRCALDSFNNRNRAKRDYRIVWEKFTKCLLALFRKQHVCSYLKLTERNTCVTDDRHRNVSEGKMILKLREERIGEYTYVTYTRSVLLPQLSFPSLFEDTINNRPFSQAKKA